jgi:phosphopantothenoylcysteine decarboxylase/phosphopantothenate--cysteine ligase
LLAAMMLLKGLTDKKVLITCGPTWVRIDDVRVISNRSTGELGHLLALEIARAGGRVTLIEGPVRERLRSRSIRVIQFEFFEELEAAIQREGIKKYDIIIHAAAVSDYRLKQPYPAKISSSQSRLKLELVSTPKLIDDFKKLNPAGFLVGFKLEPRLAKIKLPLTARDLHRQAGCDLVIVNTSTSDGYQGYILNPAGKILGQGKSRGMMAKKLTKFLEEHL